MFPLPFITRNQPSAICTVVVSAMLKLVIVTKRTVPSRQSLQFTTDIVPVSITPKVGTLKNLNDDDRSCAKWNSAV